MILSRIIKHLKEQNWTAIGIELMIVIIGVFIGAQASNWNDERRERDGERVFLQRIRQDIAGDLADTRGKVVHLRQVQAAAERADRFITAGQPCAPGRCWAVLVDFFVASQWQNMAPERGVLEALRGSIYPYDFKLKQALIRNYTVIEEGARLGGPSEYRAHVRKLIPIEAQRGLWACNQGFGATQTVNLACPPVIPDAEARAIVERLRKNEVLHGELISGASFQLSMAIALQGWCADTERVIATLDGEIGGTGASRRPGARVREEAKG